MKGEEEEEEPGTVEEVKEEAGEKEWEVTHYSMEATGRREVKRPSERLPDAAQSLMSLFTKTRG